MARTKEAARRASHDVKQSHPKKKIVSMKSKKQASSSTGEGKDKKKKEKKVSFSSSSSSKKKSEEEEVKSTAPTRVVNTHRRGIQAKRRQVRRALCVKNMMPMAQVERSFRDRMAQDFPSRKPRSIEKGAKVVLKQYLEWKLSDLVERYIVALVLSRIKRTTDHKLRHTTLMPDLVRTAVHFARGAPGMAPLAPVAGGSSWQFQISGRGPVRAPKKKEPKEV